MHNDEVEEELSSNNLYSLRIFYSQQVNLSKHRPRQPSHRFEQDLFGLSDFRINQQDIKVGQRDLRNLKNIYKQLLKRSMP